MNHSTVWLIIAIGVLFWGGVVVSFVRTPRRAAQLGLFFGGTAMAATLLASIIFYAQSTASRSQPNEIAPWLHLAVDEVNAARLPIIVLLELLTSLWTARTKQARFSSGWSLMGASVRLALFGSTTPWALIGFWALEAVFPFLELTRRKKSTRVYLLYTSLSLGLLLAGQSLVDAASSSQTANWGYGLLLAAILIRCGTFPFHSWVVDLVSECSFGGALLYMLPMSGLYAAMRLVVPHAPHELLSVGCYFSLVTAVYGAGLALVQTEVRRYFAFTLISQAALVLVGLQMGTRLGLTAALSEGLSVSVALGGYGLTMRALEARFEHFQFADFRGLYSQAPGLAVCLLVTGLAGVGFPGTLGFISADLLVEGALDAGLLTGLIVVLAAALNGIAVLRVYFQIFAGPPHSSTVSLELGVRERATVLTLVVLIFLGGLFPQPWVKSQSWATDKITEHWPEPPEKDGPDEKGPHGGSVDDEQPGERERLLPPVPEVQD